MNKTQKLLTALGLVSGVAFTAALAAVPNNTLLSMEIGDPSTYDPAQAYDTASSEPIENMYESLIGYKGKSLTELTPLLATEWKAASNGKAYTFTLRKNVKFHNGETFVCDDAEYTIERMLISHNSDAPGWFMSDPLLGFAYWDDESKKNITWAQIDKAAQCNASGQLVLTLVKRDPAFLSKLLYTATSIVSKSYTVGLGEWSGTEKDWKAWQDKDLTNSELNKKPNGTGAYSFVSRNPNQAVFKAFAGYWGGAPKIENVIIQKVDELATRVLALNKGDADIVGVGSRANLKQVQGQPGVKVLDDVPGAVASAVFLNQDVKDAKEIGSGKLDGKGIPANFFGDINIRKAFNYSFDGKKLIDQVYLGKGENRTMALPTNYLGYDPKLPLYTYNPEKATALFKKAFAGQVWENGFTINLTYNTGNVGRQAIAEILKANIEKINPKFKVNINAIAFSELLKLADTSKLAVTIGSWLADYPDTDNFIRTFYHSADGAFKGRLNYKDAQMDKLIDQANSTLDSKKRAALYKLVGRRGYDQAPFIIYPIAVGFVTYRDNIKGLEENYNGGVSGVFGTYWKNLSK
jgi:peptide/nickel transport system substrate-binding protein